MTNLVNFPGVRGRPSSSLRQHDVRLDEALSIVAKQLEVMAVKLDEDKSTQTAEKVRNGLINTADYLRSLSS